MRYDLVDHVVYDEQMLLSIPRAHWESFTSEQRLGVRRRMTDALFKQMLDDPDVTVDFTSRFNEEARAYHYEARLTFDSHPVYHLHVPPACDCFICSLKRRLRSWLQNLRSVFARFRLKRTTRYLTKDGNALLS